MRRQFMKCARSRRTGAGTRCDIGERRRDRECGDDSAVVCGGSRCDEGGRGDTRRLPKCAFDVAADNRNEPHDEVEGREAGVVVFGGGGGLGNRCGLAKVSSVLHRV